ncbi:uncharacterized protein LOC129569721 [Sitodiplosis mosellana]|uniref:uncharacterized protein LOC129569721 n=1 Tax=Sitodiplosis mosellana TaxID=263140 RepID=UPI00244462E1|nr:uncharacterized protein LOC129569721 [Sitodiplosis mosellana]
MEIDHGITKWKILGYIIGLIGIGVNIIYFDGFDTKIIVITINHYKFIILAINLIASIIWIFGLFFNKPALLLPLVIWYSSLFAIWVINIAFYVAVRVIQSFNQKSHSKGEWGIIFVIFDMVAIIATVIVLLIYILTVTCYIGFRKAIKRSRSEIPRLDVEYTAAPTKNELYPNFH